MFYMYSFLYLQKNYAGNLRNVILSSSKQKKIVFRWNF